MDVPELPTDKKRGALDPFRRAVLRGLAVLLPPLLTIVIFLWVGNTVANYLLEPMEAGARRLLRAHFQNEILDASQVGPDLVRDGTKEADHRLYTKTEDGRVLPSEMYDFVRSEISGPMPDSANEIVSVYVERRFLRRHIVIPIFLCVFLMVLYLLGKFLAAGVGRFFWMQFERVIHQLPLIRNCLFVGQTGDRFYV